MPLNDLFAGPLMADSRQPQPVVELLTSYVGNEPTPASGKASAEVALEGNETTRSPHGDLVVYGKPTCTWQDTRVYNPGFAGE